VLRGCIVSVNGYGVWLVAEASLSLASCGRAPASRPSTRFCSRSPTAQGSATDLEPISQSPRDQSLAHGRSSLVVFGLRLLFCREPKVIVQLDDKRDSQPQCDDVRVEVRILAVRVGLRTVKVLIP
jgi:hypothetical protein